MNATVTEQTIRIPTYGTGKAEKLPMFFDKRVYQGSSGRVYPYPVTEKIFDEKKDAEYIAAVLENDWLKVVVLPQLGGRIYSAYDKSYGDDFVYRNSVIKPAFVGLLGPWISGGIEFNWPQHHRPTTFMPVNYQLQTEDDGASVVVGESEAMFGLRQVTRIKLYNDKSHLEISTDVYNGGLLPQTFLWWANPAFAANNDTATIMPPDVNAVMDHGKRAVSTFPIATGEYYKMDYGKGVDISRYRNVCVPTSFMAYKSEFDFIGGYDYAKKSGLLHVADHRVAPGKKQWTWGCGDFGKAWDDNLTDNDGPYVELMTGCFTDNQPDFTFIQPRETKSFTQYFMPYRNVGKIFNADKNICFGIENGKLTLYSSAFVKGEIRIADSDGEREIPFDSEPGKTLCVEDVLDESRIVIRYNGNKTLRFAKNEVKVFDVPDAAKACPAPNACADCRRLLLYGRHIEQYRHATRDAWDYYKEGLRREPDNAELNTAAGLLLLRRGRIDESIRYSAAAIQSLTEKNGNPRDTECYYNAGVAYFFQGDCNRAEDMFAKCLWGNNAHAAAAYLSAIALRRGDDERAFEYAKKCARSDATDSRALCSLGRLFADRGEKEKANDLFRQVLETDAINTEAAYGLGKTAVMKNASAAEARIVASYLITEGRYGMSYDFLKTFVETVGECDCMTALYLAYTAKAAGENYREYLVTADEKTKNSVSVFAKSLFDRMILQELGGENSFAVAYQFGNLEYDAGNADAAAELWKKAIEIQPCRAEPYRNLALYYFNKAKDADKALEYANRAFETEPTDARLLFELYGLYVTTGRDAASLLKSNLQLVAERDDLYAEYCRCLVDEGKADVALKLLSKRKFHPWEGGEGKVTGVYKSANIALAHRYAAHGEFEKALEKLKACLVFPRNLGEGKLAPDYDNDVYYFMGKYLGAAGRKEDAVEAFKAATRGDMRVEDANYYNDNPVEYVYYAALAWGELGEKQKREEIADSLKEYVRKHADDDAEIDYFAVSLPDMLVWEQDVAAKKKAFSAKVCELYKKLEKDVCSK